MFTYEEVKYIPKTNRKQYFHSTRFLLIDIQKRSYELCVRILFDDGTDWIVIGFYLVLPDGR
jgi:hypothetical protein